jgi:hypothetical protein
MSTGPGAEGIIIWFQFRYGRGNADGPTRRAETRSGTAAPGAQESVTRPAGGGRPNPLRALKALLVVQAAKEVSHPDNYASSFQPLFLSSIIPLLISFNGSFSRMISRTTLSILPVASIASPNSSKLTTPVPIGS